jgi:hypothetical protein
MEPLEHGRMDGWAGEWENDLGFAITTRLGLDPGHYRRQGVATDANPDSAELRR